MTLDQAIEKINAAIKTAKLRKQEASFFDDAKNIQELLFAIEYELNPPIKSERKV